MWLAKLKRMMDELPEKYLQVKPADPQILTLIPPGSKPVSQLTEEEKRLDGVFHQLLNSANLETEAHIALYGEDESKHPPEACRKYNDQMESRDEEMQIISAILRRSLRERLGFENEYIINNYDVYAIPNIEGGNIIDVIFHETGDEPEIPDDIGVPGFRGWPNTES